MKKINVTKASLPPIDEYQEYLKKIWESGQLTNQGPLLREFESKIKAHIKISNFQFVTNGTLALQVSLRALDISGGEVITTPFSYVASTSAILWEGATPIFVDIEPDSLCIDPSKIEDAITPNTKAILAVHVFGNPCDTVAIESIAKKHNIKVIYDAAHSFNVVYKGKSLLDHGDISICSFHATKVFNSVEGGGIIASNQALNKKIDLIKRFGHHGDEHFMLGTNAKASEFHAAMGLCNLKYVESNIEERQKLSNQYDKLLEDKIEKPVLRKDIKYNYAYYPVIFESENKLLEVKSTMEAANIFPRRYFYPSLNTLPYLKTSQTCPISEDLSKRILCLPLYPDLEQADVKRICEIISR